MKIECKEEKEVHYYRNCKITKFCCKEFEESFKAGEECESIFTLEECGLSMPTQVQGYDYNTRQRPITYCPFCGERISLE